MNAVSNLTDSIRNLRTPEARRQLRQTIETRVNFWQATIASSFFILVLGASLFLGAVMVVGTYRDWNTSNLLTADGRTGRVARPLSDGTLCHYMIFDNKTEQTIEDRIGRCDEGKPKPKLERPAKFSWGGR
jgi:hypothetical protein